MNVQPIEVSSLGLECTLDIGYYATRGSQLCHAAAVAAIPDPEDPRHKFHPRCLEHEDMLENPDPHSYYKEKVVLTVDELLSGGSRTALQARAALLSRGIATAGRLQAYTIGDLMTVGVEEAGINLIKSRLFEQGLMLAGE